MKELDSFTVDRLKDLINQYVHEEYNDVSDEEVIKLVSIALAAKRTEPVYQYQTGIINEEGDIDWYWVDCDKGFYSQYDNQHRRIVYTTPQLNSPEIPEGWKLVPIEPTRQMMSQGHFAMGGTDRGKFMRIYQAMLAAAPEKENG